MATRRFNKESYNRNKMNVRIENTYTQSGRIANPTEQAILILKAVIVRSVGFAIRLHRV